MRRGFSIKLTDILFFAAIVVFVAFVLGILLTVVLNSASKGWIHDHNPAQMMLQFEDVAATFIYCGVVTFVILLVIKYTIGLRVSEEVEVEGLDINLHGEIVHG